MPAKPWYQSSTYHGLIVMLISIGAGYFGFSEAETQALSSQVAQILAVAGNVVATVMIARGRNVAETKITLTQRAADEQNATLPKATH